MRNQSSIFIDHSSVSPSWQESEVPYETLCLSQTRATIQAGGCLALGANQVAYLLPGGPAPCHFVSGQPRKGSARPSVQHDDSGCDDQIMNTSRAGRSSPTHLLYNCRKVLHGPTSNSFGRTAVALCCGVRSHADRHRVFRTPWI